MGVLEGTTNVVREVNRTSTPNPQLPTPKEIAPRSVPWELGIGSWRLFGPRGQDLPEHIRLRPVAFEMRLARSAVVVELHALHHVVILHFQHQRPGPGL